MKNKYIMLIISAALSISVYAQKISTDKAPAEVMKSFNTKFPSATNVSWEVENTNEYEAGFKVKGVEHSANFSKNGNWTETETEIKISELPVIIQQSIAKNYAGYKIKEASKIENLKEGNVYEAEIEKGKEHYDVLFNPKGEVLSKKNMKEDKEDKD